MRLISKKVAGLPRDRLRDNDDNFFFTYNEFVKVRDILVERDLLQKAVLWSVGFDSAGRMELTENIALKKLWRSVIMQMSVQHNHMLKTTQKILSMICLESQNNFNQSILSLIPTESILKPSKK